jgi:hypothetical protein
LIVVVTAALSAGVAAQIIGGGGGGGSAPAPSVQPPNASDQRIKLAIRFCDYYRAGNVGDGIHDLADMPALFRAMFGDDWDRSPEHEQDEIVQLYIDAMNMASVRGPGEVPDPVNPSEIAITDSQEKSAKISIMLRTKSTPTRFVLKMEKRDASADGKTPAGWRLIDGYAVGEDSWVDNIRKAYARMRGRTTPVDFMRQVHEAIRAVSRQKRASTQPSK